METIKKTRSNFTTKFKIVYYWYRRANNVPYTQFEISNNWHRRHKPSFDYKPVLGKKVTKHDEAYQKLLDSVTKNWYNIKYCQIWMHDFENMKEVLVAKFDAEDQDKTEVRNLKVIAFDINTGLQVAYKKGDTTQNVFAVGVEGGGIDEKDLRIHYHKTKAA